MLPDTADSSPTGTPVSLSGASKGVGHDERYRHQQSRMILTVQSLQPKSNTAKGSTKIVIRGNPQGCRGKVIRTDQEAESRADGKQATPEELYSRLAQPRQVQSKPKPTTSLPKTPSSQLLPIRSRPSRSTSTPPLRQRPAVPDQNNSCRRRTRSGSRSCSITSPTTTPPPERRRAVLGQRRGRRLPLERRAPPGPRSASRARAIDAGEAARRATSCS